MHRVDLRDDKIDVDRGVYRDATGATPAMRAVKAAAARLIASQQTKSHLGAEGDQAFTDRLSQVALQATPARDARVTRIQTPGGTGALRLSAKLIARTERAPTVSVGSPIWLNHAPIFQPAGLRVLAYHALGAVCI